MRVLCTGDLHIGRRPSRLSSHVDTRALSCARAWDAIVDFAIAQRVDVVALSGDVIDQSNKYFEAIGPLERGLRRLADRGIVTVAVAGNHDHDVLPQVVVSLASDTFRLLGQGGRWERTTIERPDGARLHVDGWSFPSEHVTASPLTSYPFGPGGDTPVLGLLHADLDASGSRYAPTPLSDLRAAPVALWLLGHVHGPSLREHEGTPPVLYPGSPQPMDPGEPGVHGVWIADLRPGSPVRPQHVPLATVRYETVNVDVTGIEDVSTLRASLFDHVRVAVREFVRDGGPLRHLSLRMRVTGATSIHADIERELRALVRDFDREEGNVAVCVEQATAETRPARDLEDIARGNDAAAVIARLLVDLPTAPTASSPPALLTEAVRVAAALREAKPYRMLGDEDLDPPTVHAAVGRQALLLLEELLSQKELA